MKNATRWLPCFALAMAVGCGNGSNDNSSCGGPFESSCDLPNDNGLHTCYDVVVADAAAVEQAKLTCTGPGAHGSVLTSCCNHGNAVARCVFVATNGATSTEWFLSGTVTDAQSSCTNKSGTFTAL